MKKLFFAYAWILLTGGVILSSIAGWQFLGLSTAQLSNVFDNEVISPVLISEQDGSNGGEEGVLGAVVETADARAIIVANFLERYNSPMKPYDYYGQEIVKISDKYGVDFRLLVAIAMQESNLCKVIPEGSNNCLGFGVHERGTLGFDDYLGGFDRAARELKANYIDIGLTTPEQIMRKYTPKSDGSWAASVNQWMAEMRYDDRQLGKTLKTDADLLEFTDDAEEASESGEANPGD